MNSTLPQDLSLASILQPMSPEDFFAGAHDRVPVHIPGDPDKFLYAMSWDAMSDLLNQTAIWSPASLQLYLDGQPVPAPEYASQGVTRDGAPGLLVDLDRVRGWIGRGASVVLNDIETLTPGMKEIARVLGSEPGGKVQGNLYCSWRAHQAFPVHFDTHDVFAMQIAGDKRWRIYQQHFKDPINHPEFKALDQAYHDKHCGAISQEFVMTPGDMVYIPRGFYHDAIAETDATLHLSFSVVPVIGLDLISAVFERAVHDEVFRKAIPDPDRDEKATEQHLVRLAGRFRELVREKEFQGKFVDAMRGYRYPRQQIKLPDDGTGSD